jgi:large subunit ribosomal protein L24
MAKFHIKKGDTVMVLSGEDKGRTGKVLKMIRDKERAIVEGVNIKTKSSKPTAKNPQGGFVKVEAPVHISNLSLIDPKSGKPTRISIKVNEDGKKVRIAKKSGEEIK